jgi:hypothetical protein
VSVRILRSHRVALYLRSEDRVDEAAGRYPLVEDRIQAEIMHHIRAMDRPVSRSELTDALGVSRSKTFIIKSQEAPPTGVKPSGSRCIL